MDDTMIRIINATNPDMPPWPERVTVLFEVTGASDAAVAEQLDILTQVTRGFSGTQETVLADPQQCKDLWILRKQCLWSAMSAYPDCEAMITDACVPLSRLAEIIESTRERIDASSLPCPIIAHAGDGNFHGTYYMLYVHSMCYLYYIYHILRTLHTQL